jgi:hypothetical protein
MKKNLIFIFLLSFTISCITTQKSVFYVDYSKYDDFFITESNSVSFDYLPIGSICVSYTGYSIISQIPLKEKVKNTKQDDIYYFSTKEKEGTFYGHNPALAEAIDIAVKETKGKGGNGIINFNYKAVYNKSGIQTGWFVGGMAIKRDNK